MRLLDLSVPVRASAVVISAGLTAGLVAGCQSNSAQDNPSATAVTTASQSPSGLGAQKPASSNQAITQLFAFAGNYEIENSVFADGSLLKISSYQPEFALMGITYGGDGRTNFGVPNMNPLPSYDNQGSTTAEIKWLMMTDGVFPVSDLPRPAAKGQIDILGSTRKVDVDGVSSAPAFPTQTDATVATWRNEQSVNRQAEHYIGQIALFADKIPDDFLPLDGRTLPISKYQKLFAVIGTTYGGDGVQNFKIPLNRTFADNFKWAIATDGLYPVRK